MTDKLLVLTTTSLEAEARKIAEMLIERRLAACVNIIPRIQSVYRWQGKVENAEEFLLIARRARGKNKKYTRPFAKCIPMNWRSAFRFRSTAAVLHIWNGSVNRSCRQEVVGSRHAACGATLRWRENGGWKQLSAARYT